MDENEVIENFLKNYFIDISDKGFSAYYLHPEDRSAYISFPVETLQLGKVSKWNRMLDKPLVHKPEIQFLVSQAMISGNFYASFESNDVVDFFSKYGLEDYIDKYYLGIIKDGDEVGKSLLIPEIYSEWNGTPTGELQIWRWRSVDGPDKSPLAPYERYTDHESFIVKPAEDID